MAVRIVQGDLLSATERIIGHQVNCQGVMGSGIAKLIKSIDPVIFNQYKIKCDTSNKSSLLGDCQFISVSNNRIVANLFAQYDFGRSSKVYTNYEALRGSLIELKDFAKLYNFTVALPFNIGCGLANGDWEVVSKIIEDVFHDYDITLYKLQ